MANPPRAARHWETIDLLESYHGQAIEDFAYVDELGATFKWEVDSTATADDFSVLTHNGGTAGRWIRQRLVLTGTALGDGDATIYVAGGLERIMPVSTLTGNSALTLGTTNAASGDVLTVTRRDVEAYTYQVVNGGPAAGTLCTLPVSLAYWADFRFDGTDWAMLRGGALPT